MRVVEGQSFSEENGVVELNYETDGLLAVPGGTQYSIEEGEYEVASSDEIIAVKEGSEIFLDSDAEFAAYSIAEFAKKFASDTEIWDPDETEVWYPGNSTEPSDTTKIFDPSDYDIGDPEEYTRMMKENVDTIILELADREVTGKEASETLDQLFSSMNDTYDRFVHTDLTEESGAEDERTTVYDEKKSSSEVGSRKRRVDSEEAENHLSKMEEALGKKGDERSLDDYEDAEELLHGQQAEIFDFGDQDTELEEGQSEISDW